MIIYPVLILVALILIGLGIATNPNKRYPANARPDETLWVFLVVIGLPVAVILLFY